MDGFLRRKGLFGGDV
jgi:hypothetical protein